MAFEEYVYAGTKRLRRGYTTGTCATLAAKAAATLLLTGEELKEVAVMTPAGLEVKVDTVNLGCDGERAWCSIIKDAGDDFDVTNGIEVRATVERNTNCGVSIEGGEGVGRVTAEGLDQPVGNAAINSGPRRMIEDAVQDVIDSCSNYLGGIGVLVEVPEGRELAKRTFNSMIGIVDGISVLGTSGIVEPQSLQALKDSLEVEVRVAAAAGNKRLIVTPGNYGQDFLPSLRLPETLPTIKCANFIGAVMDFAVNEGFEEILLVGHIGKLVKVAGAVMDTHSRVADCRREVFAAHAAWCGVPRVAVQEIFEAMTTDACLDICQKYAVREEVLERIADAVQFQLEHRVGENVKVGAIIFSNKFGLLATTESARLLIDEWQE